MRLPDPQRSYAVLIGTSTYRSPELSDLPAVRNNLDGLSNVLTNPGLGGLPAHRCIVLPDPTDVRTVYRTLHQYATATEDTLLVYFAGHGLTTPVRNELYLSLSDADPQALRVSALPFDVIREVLGDSPATNRVLILDCCYSGRVTEEYMSSADEAILSQLGIEGTYILTSAPATSIALAPAGAAYTAFTGELLTLLRTGIPDGPTLLTFATIYRRLLHTMTTRGLPRPGQRGTGTVDQLALTRNPAHPANPPPAPAAGPAAPHLDSDAPLDHGVEFRESLLRKSGSIASAIVGGLFGAMFIFSYFALSAEDAFSNNSWILLAILFPIGPLVSAYEVFEVLNRMRLVIDGAGITKHYDLGKKRMRVHLPWSELSTVEIHRRDTALLLVCAPKPGSALPADEQAEKLWSEGLRRFVVIDVTTLGGSPDAVSAALARYSGGRYRTENSSL